MKKLERISNKLENDKEFKSSLKNVSFYNTDDFIKSGIDYIKAIKEGRMICSIDKVSQSGMSRTLKFLSCDKEKDRFFYRNYFAFFEIMGYKPANERSDYFRIHGCGMDMVFHTNYTIIHRLHKWGFISKQECDYLAQQTPNVI